MVIELPGIFTAIAKGNPCILFFSALYSALWLLIPPYFFIVDEKTHLYDVSSGTPIRYLFLGTGEKFSTTRT